MCDLILHHEIDMRHYLMNDLPFEITSIIFDFYCEPRNENVIPQVILLSVCKKWREVTINNPRLWTIFPVPPISEDEFCVEQFDLWLQRSKQLPVYLLFERLLPEESEENRNYAMLHKSINAITDLVVANKDRVYGLNPIALPEIVLSILFDVERRPLRIWPVLSHITIDVLAISEALDVLRCCPQAAFVEFQHVLGANPLMRPLIDCQHLYSFKVEFCQDSNPAGLFNCLSTPSLEDLTCHSDAEISPISAIQALLQRSSCSLRRLHLGCCSFDPHELISFLTTQSVLQKLSMVWRLSYEMDWDDLPETKDAFGIVMRLLLTDPSGNEGVGRQFTTGEFLPRLETLEYKGPMPWLWHVVTDMFLSHSIFSLAKDGQANCDEVDFWGRSLDTSALSGTYRPLQLLRLAIIDKPSPDPQFTVNEFGSSCLKGLAERSTCRFEYDLYDALTANMYF